MSNFKGKRIVLGICGSIAAYKAAFLCRLFIKAGAEVRVVMTNSACTFISPLSLSTLSKHEVITDISDEKGWNSHVELGLWADAFIIAPATANSIAKLAYGLADNMLVATYLSAKCPVFIAPAMDLDMWKHPSTVSNLEKLSSYGNEIIDVGHGELASGLVGDGRMAEPETIVQFLDQYFSKKKAKNLDSSTKSLSGKKILITAGPSYEDLDPVRFIGNRSTGKMGIALANTCHELGADVILVLGPSHERPAADIYQLVLVRSAEEMFNACQAVFKDVDAAILAAAVADYTPANYSDQKIKKKDDDLSVSLARTKDIAAHLGKQKKENQLLIGFALETQNSFANAEKKLKKKNFDFIVLNSLEDKGAGFKHDTNKINIITANGESTSFPLKSKKKVAEDIIAQLINMLE